MKRNNRATIENKMVTMTREAATRRETTTNYSKKTEYYDEEGKEMLSKKHKLRQMETKKRRPQINNKIVIKSVKFYVKFLFAVCVLISLDSCV
jgi:hypothetical protein